MRQASRRATVENGALAAFAKFLLMFNSPCGFNPSCRGGNPAFARVHRNAAACDSFTSRALRSSVNPKLVKLWPRVARNGCGTHQAVMKIRFSKEGVEEDSSQPEFLSAPTLEEDIGSFEEFLEYADMLYGTGEYAEAEERYRFALSNFGASAVLGERLAAVLRMTGRLQEAADTLHGVSLQDDTLDESERCWILLDLGSIIEDLAPIPGTGARWAKQPWQQEKPVVPTVKVGIGATAERLSAEECYQRAIKEQSKFGEAYRRLADVRVATHGTQAAHQYFARASELLPDDICCAVHSFYSDAPDEGRAGISEIPLLEQGGSIGLAALQVGKPPSKDDASFASWVAMAAARFERHGCIVVPDVLEASQLHALSHGADNAFTTESDADLTAQTRASERRIHKALTLRLETEKALSETSARLRPLLESILQADEDTELPLLGAGCMKALSGAGEQELHKDVHGSDRHGPVDGFPNGGGGPRAVSVQIQLTDTAMSSDTRSGSLEVLPGSHRYDAANGRAEDITSAMLETSPASPELSKAAERIVPINVPAGTVTIYSSRLWHRGGANLSDRPRSFCFLTVGEPGSPAPPGLIHTMNRQDVGSWVVGSQGLIHTKAGGFEID